MRWLSRKPKSERPRPPRKSRRRLAIAAGAAAAIAVAGLGTVKLVRSGALESAAAAVGERIALAARPLGFKVEDVSVEGRAREDRDAILAALDVKRGTPILGVDLAAARARLEALPWVRSADVERLLPDTIFVHLTERQPLAFWQREGRLALVADDGTVVATTDLGVYGPLLVLVGDDAPAQAPALIAMLATEPALQGHVVAAVRMGDRRWTVRLDSGIDVALPEQDPEAAWHKLAALDREQNLLQRNILAVDLRLPDRLVLRLPPAPPQPKTKKTKPTGNPT